MCFFFIGQACTHPEQFAICHLNFPIYERSTLSKMCHNPYYKRQDSDWNWNTRATSICTFLFKYITAVYFRNYSKYIISQRRTAGKDRTICVVLICFIVVKRDTNSGITQKKIASTLLIIKGYKSTDEIGLTKQKKPPTLSTDLRNSWTFTPKTTEFSGFYLPT